jgi:predicted nucleic acid-binding protein
MLVLVDTSVWITHWRSPLPALLHLLEMQDVVTHSVVTEELAVGNLPDHSRILADLSMLLDAVECRSAKVLDFLETRRLFGLGLSWGDVQILAAAELNGLPLWTLDQRLHRVAETHGLAWTP